MCAEVMSSSRSAPRASASSTTIRMAERRALATRPVQGGSILRGQLHGRIMPTQRIGCNDAAIFRAPSLDRHGGG